MASWADQDRVEGIEGTGAAGGPAAIRLLRRGYEEALAEQAKACTLEGALTRANEWIEWMDRGARAADRRIERLLQEHAAACWWARLWRTVAGVLAGGVLVLGLVSLLEALALYRLGG